MTNENKMETQGQQIKEAGNLRLVCELGGYQLYQIAKFDDLNKPENLEMVRANNAIKLIARDSYDLEKGITEMRELVIRAMRDPYISANRMLHIDEAILGMKEFREKSGRLCPYIDSESIKLKNLAHPSGHDRNTANIRTYGVEDFLTVGPSAQGILLGSIPHDLVKRRYEELELGNETQACYRNAPMETYQRARDGKLSLVELEGIVQEVNKRVCTEFGERLMTPEIVMAHIDRSLDYIPFAVSRLESQSAILHYLESRREK